MLLLSFLFYTGNGISLPVDCDKLKMCLQHLKQLQNTRETYKSLKEIKWSYEGFSRIPKKAAEEDKKNRERADGTKRTQRTDRVKSNQNANHMKC